MPTNDGAWHQARARVRRSIGRGLLIELILLIYRSRRSDVSGESGCRVAVLDSYRHARAGWDSSQPNDASERTSAADSRRERRMTTQRSKWVSVAQATILGLLITYYVGLG